MTTDAEGSGQEASPVDPALMDALSVASLRIEQDFEQYREDASSPEELAGVTGKLLEAVRAALADQDLPEDLPRTPLSRRLLAGLRTGLLATLVERTDLPPADGMLRMLLALDRVAGALSPSWDQQFAERLSGPDGLELVVEVAHDLRSPLTSILFLAETLLRGRSGPVTPLQERQLGLVYSAAFGLSSVASDVVELVRGRDRALDLEPLPFSIVDIMESVRDIVKPIAEEKGLQILLRFPSHPMRMGYPVALNRVLLNLTTNALKFTDEGHVELAAQETEEDTVEFSVTDTGRGIPPAAMSLLYEPFRRRQRAREYAFSGSGLGLSICRKFVEGMGSELQVETGLGKGTRFHFALALPRPEVPADLGFGTPVSHAR